MWRSELLNLPGGSTVRFGDVFASFVRVPLTGSLPHDSSHFIDPRSTLAINQQTCKS
jgi:hypothetical protein